jgi:signal transduction histidine kinase
MSKGPKREATDLRLLLGFMRDVATAQSVDQVYGTALNTVQEVFRPARAFVGLSEPGSAADVQRIHPGWVSEVAVPIYADRELLGKFVLQFDEVRSFSEHDATLLEIIVAHAGAAIERIQHDQRARQERRQKDELIAMAAHELRSPLTAIVGAAYLLRSGRSDEQARALAIIERNAQSQVRLVEELLGVCQLDLGRVELEMSALDLAPVLDKVIEEIQPTAAANNTAVYFELERPLMVRGDPQRLWQVFSNLLANSVRFASPNGEVRITSDTASSMRRVQIRDNGIGISPDQLPYIFERFRQARPLQAKHRVGLGLGLSIVKDLVTMHGGTIVAESDGPARGACFTVSFPPA